MNNSIGITADIHFGRGGSKGVERQKRVFNEIVDGWIEAQITRGIIAGDLFNQFGWFTPNTYTIISDALLRAKAAGISIDIIPGNHDMDQAGLFSAVEPFEKIGMNIYSTISQLNVEGWQITFVPWVTKSVFKSRVENRELNAQAVTVSLYEQVKGILEDGALYRTPDAGHQLIIYHASLVKFSPCSTAANIVGTDFVLDMHEIMNDCGYETAVGGHFHKRQYMDGIYYVGAPERLDHSEAGNPCGWMEIFADKREPVWHELSTPRQFYTFDIGKCGDILPAAYGGIPKGAIIKLRPEFSHNDIIDREALMKPYLDAGAESVELDIQYTDEIAVRSSTIKADQSEKEQFEAWAEVNPEKASPELKKLLEFENENHYSNEVTDKFFEQAVKAVTA